tara:strand:+ start:65 stop:409 length:345 start_codon:yes stop_codon:yes gene_type:complete
MNQKILYLVIFALAMTGCTYQSDYSYNFEDKLKAYGGVDIDVSEDEAIEIVAELDEDRIVSQIYDAADRGEYSEAIEDLEDDRILSEIMEDVEDEVVIMAKNDYFITKVIEFQS